jgi:1-acyl-sn-glycerol-3-phosphate acyltransferase
MLRQVLVVAAASRLFVRPMVIGRENLDQDGPVVYAATHRSEFDIPALFGPVVRNRRDTTFLAKAELFRIPVVGTILRWLGIIPVHRGTKMATQASSDGIAVLRSGGSVIVFPAGKLAPTGEMPPAKAGAAYMALAVGMPVTIVPVAMVYTDRVKPDGTSMFRWGWRARYALVAGCPITVSCRDEEPTKAERNALTELIMTAHRHLEADGLEALAAV